MYPGKKSGQHREPCFDFLTSLIELTPDEGNQEHIREEPFTTDTTTVADSRVLLRVQCVEECASDEIGGPDH